MNHSSAPSAATIIEPAQIIRLSAPRASPTIGSVTISSVFRAATVLVALLGCQPAGAPKVPVAAPSPPKPTTPQWVSVKASTATTVARWDGLRLELALDTMGSPATPLTVTGMRSGEAVARPLDLRFTLDWNRQANGAYLKAAVYLSPHRTAGDPAALADWVRVSYIGVPPGDRWRHEVAERRAGRMRFLDRAGWPGDRSGRAPGAPKVHLRWAGDALELTEDGARVSGVRAVGWPRVYVYLTLTGHSNYPRRTIYLSDVRIGG